MISSETFFTPAREPEDYRVRTASRKSLAVGTSITRWTELSTSDALILFSSVSAAGLWAGARAAEHQTVSALFESLVCVPAMPR